MYEKQIKYPHGYILQEVVHRSGLPVKDFAAKININPDSLSRHLNSIKLSVDFIKKVEEVFGQQDWNVPLSYQGSNINIQGDNGTNRQLLSSSVVAWQEAVDGLKKVISLLESEVAALRAENEVLRQK